MQEPHGANTKAKGHATHLLFCGLFSVIQPAGAQAATWRSWHIRAVKLLGEIEGEAVPAVMIHTCMGYQLL